MTTPRLNRVDPWGDLHATPERGLLTGNRGCLVDEDRRMTRHHRGNLWIACVTSFRGWRSPLDQPGHWTPLFFLDDAVALAAGHRPCGLCRRDAYLAYRDAVVSGLGRGDRLGAAELNRRLGSERLRRGRGLQRRDDRKTWMAEAGSLPDGTVVVVEDSAHLLSDGGLRRFTFGGWVDPAPVRPETSLEVLTPPTSVLAMSMGYSPLLHPTAAE
jgi:hypothetical protein